MALHSRRPACDSPVGCVRELCCCTGWIISYLFSLYLYNFIFCMILFPLFCLTASAPKTHLGQPGTGPCVGPGVGDAGHTIRRATARTPGWWLGAPPRRCFARLRLSDDTDYFCLQCNCIPSSNFFIIPGKKKNVFNSLGRVNLVTLFDYIMLFQYLLYKFGANLVMEEFTVAEAA